MAAKRLPKRVPARTDVAGNCWSTREAAAQFGRSVFDPEACEAPYKHVEHVPLLSAVIQKLESSQRRHFWTFLNAI